MVVHAVAQWSPAFIFSDVFERKCKASVFAFDDPHFAESALAHYAEETKVVESD